MAKYKLYIIYTIALVATLWTALGIQTARAIPYCDIRKFSIVDGLAANTISDMKQSSDKLMWFTTWNGLSYYDGYSFHTFRDNPDKEDILSTNRLIMLETTAKNNIWCVASDRKLYAYDTHLCHFRKVGGEINQLFGIDLRVSKMYPLRNGASWIVDDNQQFLIRATSTQIDATTTQIFRPGEKGLRGANIWFVYEDKRGREWILSDKGTSIYRHKLSTPTPYKWIREVGGDVFLATTDGRLAVVDEHDRLVNVPLPQGITRINELKNTGYQLLIATNLGMVIYNPRSFKSTIINIQSPSQPLPEVKKMYVDHYGMVWVFTDGMGVTLVNPKTNNKQWLFADQDDPTNRTTSDHFFITQDENHNLWVVPGGGTFSYFDRKAGRLVPYLLRSNSSGNYRIPQIKKFFLSDQGVLWITGVHDLTQVVFKNHPYTLNQLDRGESEVRSIAATPEGFHIFGHKDGTIMVTNTLGQKLGYIAPSGQLTQQQVPFSREGIYSMLIDTNGRLWIGTNGDGLYMFDHGKYYHFAYDPHNHASLPHDKVFDIRADRQGRIWIATYGGGIALCLEHPDGSITFSSKLNGLNWPKKDFHKVRRINCTNDGVILVGTTDGLVTFSDNFRNPQKIKTYQSTYQENDTTTIEANDVCHIIEHSSGKIYIAELGGVLERISSTNLLQNNLLMTYVKPITLRKGQVQSMIEDNQGYIWVIRESSIDKLNPKTGQLEVFGPNDFDYNMSFTEARPFHDPATDNITVGTPMGALTFNPHTLKKSQYQPRIIFTQLHFSGESEQLPILHTDMVEIPANKRNLTISFAVLDYTRKYQTKYKYRLDGYTPEGEWIDNGSSNVIGFNHIGHGKYVLKVKATNSHGVWSKYVAELPIEVRPTFWESIWGRLTLLLLLIAIVGSIFYSYNQRQRQHINHEMSVMKNEFFSDAAHRLRTPLTLIGGPVAEVLATEHLTKRGKELLGIVHRNSGEMLDMINKMLRFDNTDNFYVNGGIDEVKHEDSDMPQETPEGQVTDENADQFLSAARQAKEDEREHQMQVGGDGEEPEPERKAVTILVVEDNKDLRLYLYNILGTYYNVLLAENGKAGLAMARKESPDFILTDVTMPVMDGITMVHHLKEDVLLKNIPIIILSAKASVEDQLKGFEEGIDAYLTKPFSVSFLLGRIDGVLHKRRAIQQELLQKLKAEGDQDAINALRLIPNLPSAEGNANTDENAVSAVVAATKETTHAAASTDSLESKKQEQREKDKAFMSLQVNDAIIEKTIQYVVDHVDSPDLKIDTIASAMGMSRSVLYNKLKNVVGMTPIDFVRHIRLMKATELLRETDDTLTSIAYNVGFSDPKYFSKVFKKEMGVIPSEYRERTRRIE